MTKNAALQSFYEIFLPNVFPQNNVPEDVTLPYLTYEVGFSKYGESYSSTVHLHFWTESEAIPNAMAEEIAKTLEDFVDLECDGGMISLITGKPAWYAAQDESNREHKHRIINVEIYNFTT